MLLSIFFSVLNGMESKVKGDSNAKTMLRVAFRLEFSERMSYEESAIFFTNLAYMALIRQNHLIFLQHLLGKK